MDRRDGKGFVSIPGATGATLTVGPVTGAENGYQYRCAVTLYGATMYSGAGQLFVTAGMIPKTGDMPGSPALLLALAGLAWRPGSSPAGGRIRPSVSRSPIRQRVPLPYFYWGQGGPGCVFFLNMLYYKHNATI